MKFVSDIRLLLIGLWLGAAVFFIAVAQSAFSVLPQRELAGAVVNRTLAVLNYSGLAIGVLLILTSWIVRKEVSRFWIWIERFLLLVLVAACAVGQFVIGLWLAMIKAQIGKPIDEVAADDPLRIQFDNLHEWSVWILFAGMIAALLAFFIVTNRKFDKAKPASPLGDFDFQKEFKI
ncbi:MAG TPA: DUF4149 domain-containing protein [Pyrinomonadaceae bacterium]|jgi:hypothetical protein|nr:DUF4149 domain-containing protein [Pyrinomonadaceae bacterium]